MKPDEPARKDDLGELRARFRARLRSERRHFARLSAALAGTAETPGAILEDLHFRAHRLKGTAAIFEFKDISAAAHTLQHATTDLDVRAALTRLVRMLGAFEADLR